MLWVRKSRAEIARISHGTFYIIKKIALKLQIFGGRIKF